MRAFQIGTTAVLAALLVGCFQNCSQKIAFETAVPQPQLKDAAAMGRLVSEIAARDLSCAQVSDCLALAVGERGCGGPEDYVVTSKNNAELDSLKALIDQVTRAQHEANQTSGLASTCEYRMPPTLACSANVCVAN